MGVTLDEQERWELLDSVHTGILTTLRSDGAPVALPVWFVTHDHRIYVRTPARTHKVARLRRDPRVCFTAETGEAWIDLRAVVLTGRAVILDDAAERAMVDDALGRKYRAFGIPADAPAATVRHYDTASAYLRIDPDDRAISWDNRKLRRRRP